MHINKKLSAALLFALLVLAGYVGIQYFNPSLFADRENKNDDYMKVPKEDPAIVAERSKPRFSGEIGGIFLAPTDTPIPEKFTTFEDVCGDAQESHNVPDTEAGALTLDLELPEEYVLDAESLNTGTLACGDDDIVYVSRKTYLYQLPNGFEGEVTIGRSFLGYDTVDVASDRPKLRKIAGRDVIMIESITENGFWENQSAYIPESFGRTFIHGVYMPRGEFMKLVQLVASSTRTQ